MKGLHFKKIDLHVHTPASSCFSDKTITPAKFVSDVLKTGIDAIAITDHNTGKWIDEIKKAAIKTTLVIFPGVEITSDSGIHILAIFDVDKTGTDVQHLLGLLQIPVEEQGKSNAICKFGHDEIVKKIKSVGALVILPHIDDIKGAFKELNGNPLTRFFNESSYDAIEVSSGVLPKDLTKAKGFKRFPTIIQSSDNPDPSDHKKHHTKGIGTKYTFFKLDENITLEGIRQCFHDPDVRLKLKDYYCEAVYPKILSLKASDGFMKFQNIEFHQGLNSIIGGKGVGKSLIIEFIRFILDQPSFNSDIKNDYLSKLDKKLGYDNFIESEIQLESGTRYKIKRVFDESSSVECTNCENGEIYNGEIKKIFPILAYSQTEVIKISENESAQLELIDNFIDNTQDIINIKSTINKLDDSDSEFSKCLKSFEEMKILEKDIETINEQIIELTKQLSKNRKEEKVFNEYKFYEDKKIVVEEQLETFQKIKEVLMQYKEELNEIEITDIPPDLDKDALITSNNKKIITFHNKLINRSNELENEFNSINKDLLDKFNKYKIKYNHQYKKYKATQKNEENRKKLISKRKELVEQKTKLENKFQKAKKTVSTLDQVKSGRNILITELLKSYKNIYNNRKLIFDELTKKSNGRIKLTIAHAKNYDKYFEQLIDLLSGSNIRKQNIESIVKNILPNDFVPLVLSNDKAQLSTKADIPDTIAEKVIMKLMSNESYTDLLNIEHSCYPDDIPKIEFRIDPTTYSPLNELSVGQKCTALLIIALSEGRYPVIIDQPEDALDIATVWEDISKKLRGFKDQRQFILTTHNASVAVSSDSDMFIIIRSNAKQANVKCLGSIDISTVKDEVMNHLEGGIEPYSLRKNKYNLK